jgi:hypothetical protein
MNLPHPSSNNSVPFLPLASMTGREKRDKRHNSRTREGAMEALILQKGEDRNLELLLLPPQKLSGGTSPKMVGTAPQHRANTTPPPADHNPQHTNSTSSLATTAGRRRRR